PAHAGTDRSPRAHHLRRRPPQALRPRPAGAPAGRAREHPALPDGGRSHGRPRLLEAGHRPPRLVPDSFEGLAVRRRPRRDIEVFSLSFLDCICCGFGAIILLLTLVKRGDPRAIEQAPEALNKRIARLQEELYEIRGETDILSRELVGKREQLSRDTVAVARLQGDLEKMRGQFRASKELSQVQDAMQGRFLAAQQQLTEEMKRLKEESERPPPVSGLVGGIPVDSEYVIFVIDTSGSMQRYAWPLLLRKMSEILDAYPKVKGMQVMNDEGVYMFSSYAGK